jgi:hypothetical protein
MWDILTNDEKNESLIKILIHAAFADGGVDADDLVYLRYVCDCLQMPHDIIEKYSKSDPGDHQILPSDEVDRVKILYHLLFLINADSIIKPEEELVVYNLAFKLGFNELMTREFIELMKTYSVNNLPDRSMISILKKYNN